jgi:predicted nucleotidyltransferase
MGRGGNNQSLQTTVNAGVAINDHFSDEKLLVEQLLNQAPFEDKDIALVSLTGSKAHGLAHPESDTDLRGIYLASFNDLLGIKKPADSLEGNRQENDIVVYELAKFANLASKANPSVLEFLWSPVLQNSESGETIIANRNIFLSQLARKTYSGFIFQQLKDIERFEKRFEEGELDEAEYRKKRAKRARHLVRLSEQGVHLLKDQEMIVQVQDLTAIQKAETATLEELQAMLSETENTLKKSPSPLPEQPDWEAINQLIVDLRLLHRSQ